MKRLLVSIFTFLLTLSPNLVCAYNLGHRLGGDYYKNLPENSLLVLKTSVEGADGEKGIMEDSDFSYFEFDVQETYDNEIVIFHDKDFKRMLPNKGRNKKIYKKIIKNIKKRTGKKVSFRKLRVKLVTLEEIQSLWLKGEGDQHVPTLFELLDMAAELRVTKPLVVEIKRLHSDTARDEMLRLASDFKESYGLSSDISFTKKYNFPQRLSITFLAFKSKFKYSFPSKELKKTYCDEIKVLGLGGIYKARGHSKNLCNKLKKKKRGLFGLGIFPFFGVSQ